MRAPFLLLILSALFAPARVIVLESHEDRITRLEHQMHHADVFAGGALLCAALCALWAQNTHRNCWLWFFLGLIFSIFAVLVMLYKNAGDLKARKRMDHSPLHS